MNIINLCKISNHFTVACRSLPQILINSLSLSLSHARAHTHTHTHPGFNTSMLKKHFINIFQIKKVSLNRVILSLLKFISSSAIFISEMTFYSINWYFYGITNQNTGHTIHLIWTNLKHSKMFNKRTVQGTMQCLWHLLGNSADLTNSCMVPHGMCQG